MTFYLPTTMGLENNRLLDFDCLHKCIFEIYWKC